MDDCHSYKILGNNIFVYFRHGNGSLACLVRLRTVSPKFKTEKDVKESDESWIAKGTSWPIWHCFYT